MSRAFEEAGFYSEVDDNDKTTLKKKMMLVRQRKMHNYVMVVGKDEVSVNEKTFQLSSYWFLRLTIGPSTYATEKMRWGLPAIRAIRSV